MKSVVTTISSTFPVFSVTLLLTWSIYAIIFKLIYKVSEFPHKLSYTVLFGIEFFFCIWSYYAVLYNGPGSPLDCPMLCVNEYEEGYNEEGFQPPEEFIRNSHTCKKDGGFRFCGKCKVWKPDRCHHCSGCEKCVLKMDHHCPWFGQCIGFKNYREFVQFLVWTNIYLIGVCMISAWTVWGFFVDEKWKLAEFSLHVIFLFFLSCVFEICLIVFLGFTMYQVFVNRSTIESYEYQSYKNKHKRKGEIVNVFDLGWKQNWQEVMGYRCWQWFIPTPLYRTPNLDLENSSIVDWYQSGICFPVNAAGENDASLILRLSGEFSTW